MDMDFDCVALHLFAPAVETFFDLRAREDVPWPLHEQLTECKLLWRQRYFASIAGHTMGCRVQGDTQVLDLGFRPSVLAAQERADASGELVEVEWLYEVVVGAGV